MFANDSAASLVRPKSRTARPRPCFDDGSLTRVFKFPSKAYPKSTYYVTSSEVIIRIKKARKKWKLVVPKKRVASYRTNRWFAKPRWIELELTFTQASRLGLVPPRKVTADANSDTAAAAEPQITSPDGATNEVSSAPSSLTAHEIDEPAESQVDVEFEAKIDDSEEPVDDEKSDAELVSELSEGWDERILQDTEVVERAPMAVASYAPPAKIVQLHYPQTPVVVIERPGRETSKKSNLALLAAGLALLLVGGTSAWLTIIEPSVSQTAEVPGCLRPDALEPCARGLSTGSLETTENARDQIQGLQPAPETFSEPEPIVASKSLEREAQKEHQTSTGSSENLDNVDARSQGVGLETPRVSANTQNSEPPPAVVMPANQPTLPQNEPVNRGQCRAVAFAAQSISIRFDYASPHLDRAFHSSLSDFVAKLRACPSVMITIEGHTDSDGHDDRNEALSWRRAEAVREQLIVSGAKPEQLSAIGFGHARPYLPNVSAGNKRKNRRAAIVVEHRP
jgi:outer membrane protein OmpA-like peptidoglycan-associated protein